MPRHGVRFDDRQRCCDVRWPWLMPSARPAQPPRRRRCRRGAGAPGAPATPAARSRAAFTAWPLKVRVGRKLAELVPDHLLGDIHRDEFLAVVHGDGVADHVRHDRRAARPRLDHFLFVARVQRLHLLAQVAVDERPFFQRTCHRFSLRRSSSARLVDLFFHPAQLDPLRAPHLAESAHRPGNAVRQRAERDTQSASPAGSAASPPAPPIRACKPVQHRLHAEPPPACRPALCAGFAGSRAAPTCLRALDARRAAARLIAS